MAVLIIGFIAVTVTVLLVWAHFNPTGKVAAVAKTAQTSALDASIMVSNAAEKATAEVTKLELTSMRKWFSADAQPHLDALLAENETYLTEVAVTK